MATGLRLSAETGYDAWLRYSEIDDARAKKQYESLPAMSVVLGDSPVVKSAQEELLRGVRGMLGRTLRTANRLPGESAIVLGTFDSQRDSGHRPHGGIESGWLLVEDPQS